MLEKIAEIDRLLDQAEAGGGPAHHARLAVRGKLPVRELEGLFRHIYRHDTTANALNRQKSFKLMRQVFSDDPRSWRPSAQAT